MVYTSFPILGYMQAPSWVEHVRSTFQNQQDVVVYNPRLSMEKNDNINQGRFYTLLNQPIEPTDELKATFEALKLDLSLTTRLMDFPKDAFEDDGLSANIVFRDLYILIRCFMLVADANNPSFGGVGQEVLYAHLLNKTTVIVSDRYAPGPWFLAHCDAVVPSKLAAKEVAVHLMAYEKAVEAAQKAEFVEQTPSSLHDSIRPSEQ